MAAADIPRKAYRVSEAAKALGLSEDTVTALANDGTLPSVRVGRARLIPARALDDLLDGLAVDPAETNGAVAVSLAARLRAHEERIQRLEARMAEEAS